MHWYYALFCMCYILQWRSIFKNCYTSFVFTKLTLVSGSSFFAGKTAYEKYLKWIPCGCSHCKLGILPFFKHFFFFLSLSNSLTEVLHKIKFVFLKSIVENTIISCIRERISLYYSFPLVAHRTVIFKMYFITETQSSKYHTETESTQHHNMRHIENICAFCLTL